MSTCIGDNTLVGLVENSLSEGEVERLEQHLARCADCRLRRAALAASPSRLAEAPTTPVGIGAHIDIARGTRVGRFVVGHEIGRGGMGVVFAARDPQLDRPVALKLLHSAGGDETVAGAQERLLGEARAMAHLDHPNILTVYEAGRYRHETYLAMEMIHGETLSQWLDRWQRPWTSILDAFRQAGSALAHAHGHGLAHGDFKPENVLVDDTDRVRVTDFGLSRWFEREGLPLPERASFVGGTPRYMAPEQFQGRPADARSDQFSFCVALYEALYGRHPCARGSARSLLELPEHEALAPLRADARADTRVPGWLHAALCRGLDPDPAQRHPSMDALLEALATPASRAPGRLAVVAAVALLLMSGMGYALGAWHAPGVGLASSPPGPAASAGASDAASGGGSGAVSGQASGQEASLVLAPLLGASPGSRHAARTRLVSGSAAAASSAALGVAFVLWRMQATFASAGPVRMTAVAMARSIHDLVGQEIQRAEARLSALRRWHDALALVSEPPASALAPLEEPRAVASRAVATSRVERSIAREVGHAQGLGLPGIERGIAPRWRDLQVCFHEWRERQPDGRDALAARLAITPEGHAFVQRLRGLPDRVVRKCVTGALERASFALAPRGTAVELTFVSQGRELRMRKSLAR